MPFRPFDDEQHLKPRRPRDLRPRIECPVCFERAIVLGLLPSCDGVRLLYVTCAACDFCGEVEDRAA